MIETIISLQVFESPLEVLLPEFIVNESAYYGGIQLAFTTNETADTDHVILRWDYGPVNETDLSTALPTSADWHFVEIWAFDQAQNEAYALFRFASLVTIQMMTPSNSSYTNGGLPVNLNLSATPSQAIYHWNNSIAKPTLDPIPLADGVYELAMAFQSASGHWSNYTVIYYVDNIASQPVLSGVHGPIRNGSRVQPLYDLEVRWADSQEPVSSFWAWDGEDNSTVLPSTPLAGGNHTLRWWLTYPAGNVNTSMMWIVVDKEQLSFDLSAESPPVGSAVQSGVLLNFTANEEPFVVYVQWDDSNETVGWENVTTPTGEGNHTLSVRIADEAGWWTTQSFWWAIDNTPPPISITPSWTDLTSKPWRNGTMIDVYTENGTLQYSWDSASNHSAEYPNRDELHLTISLADGSHELCIYAIDSAGNVNVTQSIVLVDSTPISFEFPEPRNGSSHNSAVWVTIVFSESPDQLNITWLGIDLAGEWTSDTELKVKLAKKNGWHELEVAVKDEAGNLTLKTLRVKMLDDPAPLYLVVIAGIVTAVLGGGIWIKYRTGKLSTAQEGEE